MMRFYPGIDSSAEVARVRRGLNGRQAGNGEQVVPEKETVSVERPRANAFQALFAVGDPDLRLSLAFAMKQGYKIRLEGDGEGEVRKIDGTTYHIHRFECDCPDKLGRGGSYNGRCKHQIWLSQLRPCSMCGAIMYLGEFRTAFAEVLYRFECRVCGNVRDASLVREERRGLRNGEARDEALTPEGRCRQALAWLKARRRVRYLWNVLEQSPDLAPVMVRLLIAEGEIDLAHAVAGKYGVQARVA